MVGNNNNNWRNIIIANEWSRTILKANAKPHDVRCSWELWLRCGRLECTYQLPWWWLQMKTGVCCYGKRVRIGIRLLRFGLWWWRRWRCRWTCHWIQRCCFTHCTRFKTAWLLWNHFWKETEQNKLYSFLNHSTQHRLKVNTEQRGIEFYLPPSSKADALHRSHVIHSTTNDPPSILSPTL